VRCSVVTSADSRLTAPLISGVVRWLKAVGGPLAQPRFRFLQKLEAQKNDRKDRSRIKDPKQSVEELFHPQKAT
jgi:hypothetical protein